MRYLTTNYFLAAATLCRISSATALGRHLDHYGHHHYHASPSASDSDSAISTSSYFSTILQASTSSSVSDTAPTSTELVVSSVVTVADVATATSSSASTSSTNSLTPNGVKAGLSGYVGVQNKAGFSLLAEHISWYSDYSPSTPDSGTVQGIPMLWGISSSCTAGSSRLSAFQTSVGTTKPKFMFGFYEPDYGCPSSSNIAPADATIAWNTYIAPLAADTILGSPSMAKQKDEKWLTPFSVDSNTGASLLNAPWNVTSIHINKLNLTGVQADVEYYVAKYKKPVWVSEFACVDDTKGFTPCTDQTVINDFLTSVVPWLQANESVVAYGPSNGEGLGTVWPLLDSTTGNLTATGTTYLNILQGL